MKALERERPEIWETELQASAGDELEEVRTHLGLAIRETSSNDLHRGSVMVMGTLREALKAASLGPKVNEDRLSAVVEGISNPTVKKLVRASGELILKVQNQLPNIPRPYIDVHLAFEANRIVHASAQN